MSLQLNKSICHFFKSTSGLALGGGCTKAFLDSVHGDVSRVMSPTGGPIWQGSGNGYTNNVDGIGNPVSTVEADMTNVSPGLIACVDGSFFEITSVSPPDWATLNGWVGSAGMDCGNDGGNTVLYGDSSSFMVGDSVHVRDFYGAYIGSYTVIYQSQGSISVSDELAIYNGTSGGFAEVAKTTGMYGSLYIGGAYNNLQTVLNNVDAYYHDQWLFFNEDIAPAAKLSITSAHDGENNNNTRLYIVGYNTHAYDCVPYSSSYLPAGTQNVGTHYKSALQRSRYMSDASISADLPIASTANLADYNVVFNIEANAENIILMGIFFRVDANKKGIGVVNDTTGSAYMRHCAVGTSGYDASPQASALASGLVSLGGMGTGGAVYDCFAKGVGLLYVTTNTVNTGGAGAWEISYCVTVHGSSMTVRNFGLTAHHNVLIYSPWGLSVSARGSIVAFSNIIYKPSIGGIVFDGADSRLSAYNNIFVIDEDVSLYGLIGVLNGSTVYWDYNCYCNPDGSPMDVFISGPGGGADNVNYNYGALQKGAHDVEANPQFADPDNFDFNLKSASPCIGAGRPDIVGNPTSIGLSAVPAAVTVGIYGKKQGFYGD